MILKSKFKLAALVGFSFSVVSLLVHLLLANYSTGDLIQYHPTLDDFYPIGQVNRTLIYGLFIWDDIWLYVPIKWYYRSSGLEGYGVLWALWLFFNLMLILETTSRVTSLKTFAFSYIIIICLTHLLTISSIVDTDTLELQIIWSRKIVIKSLFVLVPISWEIWTFSL